MTATVVPTLAVLRRCAHCRGALSLFDSSPSHRLLLYSSIQKSPIPLHPRQSFLELLHIGSSSAAATRLSQEAFLCCVPPQLWFANLQRSFEFHRNHFYNPLFAKQRSRKQHASVRHAQRTRAAGHTHTIGTSAKHLQQFTADKCTHVDAGAVDTHILIKHDSQNMMIIFEQF